MPHTESNPSLPWSRGGPPPLMLAPMQGITNRGLRAYFIERVRPDVVFTEYVRVQAGARKVVSSSDRQEVTSPAGGVPLVVQLIGADREALVAAAGVVQGLGAVHLNINLGCPYGRMGGNSAGGALLREPLRLAALLEGLRRSIVGGFSVKCRAGFEDPGEIFALLEVFEGSGVDFLILHPRTVVQRYGGTADHQVTARVVSRTRLPVIANGDIFAAATGRRVLAETGAAGLMLGRGAVADPYLFARLRGERDELPSPALRRQELRDYLAELLGRYEELFCGEQQILAKMKEVLAHLHDPELAKTVRQLRRCKRRVQFAEILAELG